MTGVELWIWLASNPWRTVAIGLALSAAVLGVILKIQSMRIEILQKDLGVANVALGEARRIGDEQQKRVEESNKLLSDTIKRQQEDKMKLAKLLKDWPEDCDAAADRALEIAKRVKK